MEPMTLLVGGRELQIIPTPGHTKDSICILDKEANALFTGDTIVGEPSAIVDDMESYMRSLELLLELAPDTILPGHGKPDFNGPAKIDAYIKRTKRREDMIVKFIKRGSCSLDILWKRMYLDGSEAGKYQIKSHLAKLANEGVAKDIDGSLTIA